MLLRFGSLLRHAFVSNIAGICALAAFCLAATPASALLAPTTTTVTASANPIPAGSPVTFTATVTSAAGTPDGTVVFLADLVSLGVGTLDGTGKATFTTSTLPTGVHAIVAIYVGNLNFATSTSIGLNISVSLAACTISVAASVNPLVFGTPVNLTVTVSGNGATPTVLLCWAPSHWTGLGRACCRPAPLRSAFCPSAPTMAVTGISFHVSRPRSS
jgi:hypothetical protein